MTVTYFLYEASELNGQKTQTLLRIIDRDTVLISTNFTCVYTTRRDAAMVLRAYRFRRDNPFYYGGEQRQFMSYEKNIGA